jgi:Family of unknown function (DUF6065)
MKLTAYVIDPTTFSIRPAPVERDWMDATNDRFAYRCLPLNIANACGWEILNPFGFSATWTGGAQLDAVRIIPDPGAKAFPISHFGHGTLTFHIPCLFVTEPATDLMVQGPINRPKDGISPLSAIVETDWAPYTFTMNWVFTRPEVTVRFQPGEPFCHIFPLKAGELENVQPQVRPLSDNPELRRRYSLWTDSRNKFNADLKQPGSAAQVERWQKLYYRGVDAQGEVVEGIEHRTRLRLQDFAKS